MEQEEERLRHLQDLASLSEKRGFCTYSDFLPAADAALAYRAAESWRITLWGGAEGCEKQMVRFAPDGWQPDPEAGEYADFPIAVLEIKPLQAKFAEALTHRDYLGALMSLGITRESMGDVLVREGGAVLFAQEKLTAYICGNLIQVRHTSVRCKRLPALPASAGPQFEALSFTLPSLRADAFVSQLARLSRGKAEELFAREGVFINGRLCEKGSTLLKEGDILTIRHFGKFIFRETAGESRKGRLIVRADKYT